MERASSIDLGRDAYGRSVTATREQTYDGKWIWKIISDPVSQRDDGERTSGLSDQNIVSLIWDARKLLPNSAGPAPSTEHRIREEAWNAAVEACAKEADAYEGAGTNHDYYSQLGDSTRTKADIAAACRFLRKSGSAS